MIVHYVEEHGYAPPEDFVEGVLRDPERAATVT
jgi:hypothetical protein